MKKLIMAFAVVLAAVASYGEVMYWQVNTLQTNAKDYTMARVKVYNGDTSVGYLNVIDDSSTPYVSVPGGISLQDAEGGLFDLGNYSSAAYSFALELVNDNFDVMGSTKGEAGGGAQTYAQLQSAGVIQAMDSIMPLDYAKTWNAGFVDIPEPTSGLMLLLGASLLALRRKRA